MNTNELFWNRLNFGENDRTLTAHFGVRVVVPEGRVGLLYRHGQYRYRLSPGKHRFWRSGYTVRLVDMRRITLTVPGQEVLSADNIAVKLSALLTYQLVQPEKALHDVQDYASHLYNLVQLAIRPVVGGLALEALLTQRTETGAQLVALVKREAEKIGVVAHSVELKDVILPAELKKAFSETVRARQEGQAALERARGESAALRNLANAARLLDDNPSLMNLRVLQSLAAAQNGNTLVMGLPAGFVPLKNGKAPHPPEEPPHNAA
jgi:regulator of protease activity HflC (stomatin/prohibitin superfamily)